jgi:hypothetical protein
VEGCVEDCMYVSRGFVLRMEKSGAPFFCVTSIFPCSFLPDMLRD